MFKISIREIVVETSNCIHRFNRDTYNTTLSFKDKNAVYFSFELQCSNKSVLVRRDLKIIVSEHKEVFFCETGWLLKPKPEAFHFYSMHDSCWKSLDFIHGIYSSMASSFNEAPADLEWHSGFGVKLDPIKVVSIITEPSSDYRRVLKDINFHE